MSYKSPPAAQGYHQQIGAPSLIAECHWESIACSLGLSDRECQIAKKIVDDDVEVAIATHLGISVNTVHTHLARIYRKLGIRSRAALVSLVFREHITLHLRPFAQGSNQRLASSNTSNLPGEQ